MTVHISPDVADEILAKARRCTGDRELERLADEYGLFPNELKRVLLHSGRTAPPRPIRTEEAETKVCTKCETEQPVTEFYEQRNGRMAQCRTCKRAAVKTEVGIVRQRARQRALLALAKRHPDEFRQLVAVELGKAVPEHEQIKQVAAANHDAPIARLRGGRRRKGERALDRVDVARCTTCHTHHDAGHACPGCGTVTQPASADQSGAA